MFQNRRHGAWTRREFLEFASIGGAVTFFPQASPAAVPTFPEGAVIRTVLRDYAPDELAGNAVLFHEHMSFALDMLSRFDSYSAATAAANGTTYTATGLNDLSFMQDIEIMVDELTAAKREGVGCIVDGGHPDMGRNVGFLRQLSMPLSAAHRGWCRILHAAVLSTRDQQFDR